MTEKHGQISPGSPNHSRGAVKLSAGNCFYVEIISQVSLRNSPVCLFVDDVLLVRHLYREIRSLFGDRFCSNCFNEEITGVEYNGVLTRRGCYQEIDHLT